MRSRPNYAPLCLARTSSRAPGYAGGEVGLTGLALADEGGAVAEAEEAVDEVVVVGFRSSRKDHKPQRGR